MTGQAEAVSGVPRRQVEVIFGLADCLRRSTRIDEFHDEALQRLEECLQADRSSMALLDDAGTARLVAWRGLSDKLRSGVEAHSSWPAMVRSPEPALIADVAKEGSPDGLREAMAREGIGAAAFIPLMGQDGPLGNLALYYDKPHAFDDNDLLVAGTIAGLITSAVQRVRVEEDLRRNESESNAAAKRLRESEERYRRLIDYSPEAMAVVLQEKLVYVNPAAVRLAGAKSPAELLGKSMLDFATPEFVKRVQEQDETGGLLEGELRNLRGEAIDVELVSILTTFEGQPARQLLIREIVRRKRAERALREAEEKYRSIFENVPIGVFQTTPKGRFISANEASARMFLYNSAKELMEQVHDIAHEIHVDPERRTEFRRLVEQNDYVSGFECQAYRKDRSVIWISLTGRAVRDTQGKVLYYEGMVEDITARKQADEERERLLARIQAERTRVQDLLAHVPGVVWEAYSAPGEEVQRIEFVSKYVERMLGYSVEQWLSTPDFWLRIMPEEDRERAQADAAEILADKHEGISEFRWVTRDGRTIWVEARSSVIQDAAGKPMGIRAVTMDVTERKLAEQRQRLLVEISSILYSTPDSRDKLQDLVAMLIGSFADICFIDLQEDGAMRRAASASKAPDAGEAFSSEAQVQSLAGDHPAARVTLTLRPEVHSQVTDALLVDMATEQAPLEDLQKLRLSSVMFVPISAGGQAMGTITLARKLPGSAYDPVELIFAEEMARRVGVAIDNSARYEREQAARAAAERATQQLSRLQQLTDTALSHLSLAELLKEMLKRVHELLGVDTTTVFLLNGGGGLMARASVGLEEEIVERLSVPLNEGFAGKIAARKEGRIVNDMSRFPVASPVLREKGVRSMMGAPLMVGAQLLGVLEVGSLSSRQFAEEDLDLLQLAGDRLALAIGHVQLYEAEQRARLTAEEAAERTARLQTATAALSEAVTPEQVANILVQQAASAMRAAGGSVVMLTTDGRELEIAACEECFETPEGQQLRTPMDPDNPMPLPDAVKENRPVFIRSREEASETYPGLLEADTTGKAWAAIPLTIQNLVAGGLALRYEAPREFSNEDTYLLLTLARLGSQALERARLYNDEQAARAEAEAAGQRAAFLAKTSEVLSSSLDYEISLTSLAQLCVPHIADWCAIDVVGEEGEIKRVAVEHSDPAKVQLARELRERFPPDPSEDVGIPRILRTGQGEFYANIDESVLEAGVQNKEMLALLKHLGLRSAMIVPLQARGRTLGVLTLVTAESGRVYKQEDMAFAQELARRAGLAVDNARLYSKSQRVQEELRIANEAKDEFLGMVSHELRTPITTIYGGSRLLGSQSARLDDESQAEILKDIEQEAERLHRIVEDLLVLARMELGQELVTEPVLVQRVVAKTVASLAKRRPMRTVSVHCEKETAAVSASPGYLEQILRNLLNNADKYSPVGEPIDIVVQDAEGGVVITVADRGSGIPAEEAELIFERFYRSGRTAKQAGGAGIGLTVCKRLVEAQSGRIWARPRAGGGTEVSSFLPLYHEPAS